VIRLRLGRGPVPRTGRGPLRPGALRPRPARLSWPGELVHVRPDLSVRSEVALPEPPARLVPIGRDNSNVDT
jgi:hypothetical protein